MTTSALIPYGPDYKAEHELGVETHLGYTPLGWAPESRQGHDDTPTGWESKRGEEDYTPWGLLPPPPHLDGIDPEW